MHYAPSDRFSFLYLLLLATLLTGSWGLACTGASIETIETKDEQGRAERYERRKKDFAKEGLYQKFQADGKLLKEAHYVNDTLEGECKYYHATGKLESVERYKRGVLHGKYEDYYEGGQLQIEQTYVNGALQGLSIAYYPNGQVKEKVTLQDNEENGPFTEYYENGALKTEGQYKPGEEMPLEHGELKEYDEQGQLVRTADCNNGACLTKWKKEM